MSQDRLTTVVLNVSNLMRSLEFYRDVVGIPLHEASHDAELNDPWYGGDHAAYSWTDGSFMHFAIYPQREPNRPVTTAAQIGFQVSDFESAYVRVMASDSTMLQEARDEPWGKTARFLDPDGNIVSITG
jgi:lactoylglutathione lyase